MAEVLRRTATNILGPEWLAGQRWMRGKHRTVAQIEVEDLIPLDGPDAWLAVLAVAYRDELASVERYAVPLVARDGAVREPMAGDGAWRALATITVEGGERAGTRGSVEGTPTAAGAQLAREAAGGARRLADLAERPLGVEQSNTSVVLGGAVVLKLYRLLEPGDNPEVEVATFLTEAGFTRTPAVHGSARYVRQDGSAAALAMAQAFVANEGDAWHRFLRELATPEGLEQSIADARAIGALTADMHTALASRADNQAFPNRAASAPERAAWLRGAEELLGRALDALDRDGRRRLAAVAPAVSRGLAPLADSGATEVRVTRIHGDYHLGQLLSAADGFMVTDFEGEPARSLAARRSPASPLRDVAGMLRSLDYAARTSEKAGDRPAFDAAGWLQEARAAFLDAYRPLAPAEVQLLAALELEKACYEVVYEATSRPDWAWLPLAALERMVA